MALVVTNASNIILDSIDHMLNKVELDYKGELTAKAKHVCMYCMLEVNFSAMNFVVESH